MEKLHRRLGHLTIALSQEPPYVKALQHAVINAGVSSAIELPLSQRSALATSEL